MIFLKKNFILKIFYFFILNHLYGFKVIILNYEYVNYILSLYLWT